MLKIGGTLFPIVARFVFFGTASGVVGALGLVPPQDRREQPLGVLLGEHRYCVRCVAFAPDGRTLATVGGFSDSPGEIKLWDVATGTERATFRGNQSGIQTIAFAPDGRMLATGSGDQIVTLWDAATGRERGSVPGLLPKSLRTAMAADGQTLAVAGWDVDPGSVRLWQLADNRERRLAGALTSTAFSTDGRLNLWRLAPHSEDRAKGSTKDSALPLSATLDRTASVQTTDIPMGRERLTLRADPNYVWALAFSPDGRTLATGGFDETVKLWDVESGRERGVLWGHTDQVGAVAFAPDGKVLASGSHDTTVKLWSTETGEELATFREHTGTVTSVAFDPTGQWIASGSHDRTVRLWPAAQVR